MKLLFPILCALTFAITSCGDHRNIDYDDRDRRLEDPSNGNNHGSSDEPSAGTSSLRSVATTQATLYPNGILNIGTSSEIAVDSGTYFFNASFYVDLNAKTAFRVEPGSDNSSQMADMGSITCRSQGSPCDGFHKKLTLRSLGYVTSYVPESVLTKEFDLNYENTSEKYQVVEASGTTQKLLMTGTVYKISANLDNVASDQRYFLLMDSYSVGGTYMDGAFGYQKGFLFFGFNLPSPGSQWVYDRMNYFVAENNYTIHVTYVNSVDHTVLLKKLILKHVQN